MSARRFLFSLLVAGACLPGLSVAAVSDGYPLRFDFGGGAVAEGYLPVPASMLYSGTSGYGFEPGYQPVEVVNEPRNRRTPADPLTGDHITCEGERPVRFSVKLPEGNYKVTVTLGNPAGASKTTVKAETRRLMLESVETAPGQTRRVSFNVNIRTPQLSSGNVLKLDSHEWDAATGEIKSLTWDDKLTLQFSDEAPSVCAVEIEPLEDAVTLFVIGDSTVTDQRAAGTWAQYLPRWFGPGVVVANHAESGQTLKGFRFQRRWDKVMESVREGDYLFIQLGTNDEKSKGHDPMWPADDRAGDWVRTHSAADTDYIWELATMAVEARRHGVTPVIVSPMTKIDRTRVAPTRLMDAYGKAARKAAELAGCAFIDLWGMSVDIVEASGEDALRIYSDGTHTDDYGGYLYSLCIAKGIRENGLELAEHLTPDLIDIDPKAPAPRFADFTVPVEKRTAPRGGGATAMGFAAEGLAPGQRFPGDDGRKEAAAPSVMEEAFLQAGEIVRSIRRTEFPKRTFSILDFGAVAGDPGKLNHEAINLAILACSQAGGGTVVVPAGEFHTGPLTLKSNVELHLEQGAVLKFTTDPSCYFPAVLTRWEGIDCYNAHPLIYAHGESNVALTGKGVIDGQGSPEHWWYMKGSARDGWKEGMPSQLLGGRDRLLAYAEASVPVDRRIMTEQDALRPQLVNFYRCNRVLIEGVTLKDSPFWAIHPVFCEDLIVRGVTIDGEGPNGDGCNPESCKNVLIEGCRFNTGDDCIAIKSGRNADGRRWGVPSENIVVRDCRMAKGHGGIVIGSEISGGYRNLYVENCEMDSPQLDRVVRIKTSTGRGGVIENVYVRNIRVGQCNEAVLRINLKYESDERCDRSFPPVVRNVYLEKITCGKSKYGILVNGLDESENVYDIHVADCTFDQVASGGNLLTGRTGAIRFSGVEINGRPVREARSDAKEGFDYVK